MRPIFVVLIAAALLLSGCTQPQGNGNGAGGSNGGVSVQAVGNGDTIKVEYKGTLGDGTQFDSSEGRDPLEFTVGAGQMIKGFDAAVVGMALNQEKTVALQPADAYGAVDQSKIVELPKSQFAEPDKLVEGLPIHAQSGVNGIVKEVKEETIVVDFNHPLAGKTLTFWIKVVDIQK